MKSDSEPVLCSNPHAQYLHHRKPIEAAIARVLESGWYILGKEVAAFERSFSEFMEAGECAGVANGTDAIALALRAVGVGPGDEVITVSHTAVATVAAIEQIGAVPVFADISAPSRGLDPGTLPELINERTRAVVPVHIYGQPCEIVKIVQFAQEHGLKVIEDCAQAHGARVSGRRVGTFGDIAAFSFYPTKNLGTLGDGGAITSRDSTTIAAVRMLAQYGWKERYISEVPGINSRLDELHAAILSAKLPSLDADNDARRSIAARYDEALRGGPISPPPRVAGTESVYHLYVVECSPESRDRFREHLLSSGIQTALHYPLAVHQQPAYRGRIRGGAALKNTELLYQRIVSLPMYPELQESEVDRVCRALKSWK